MIKQKKPWYIWLSVLAFVFLWSDSSRRLKFSRKNLGLWYRSVGNALKLWSVYVMIIPISFGIFMDRVILRNVPNESLLYEIMISILLLLVYIGGVYATYRHSVWRKENISHLLKNSNQQPLDDDESNNF